MALKKDADTVSTVKRLSHEDPHAATLEDMEGVSIFKTEVII